MRRRAVPFAGNGPFLFYRILAAWGTSIVTRVFAGPTIGDREERVALAQVVACDPRTQSDPACFSTVTV